jgi:hypothetical protein
MPYQAASELGFEVAQSNTAWLLQNMCPSSSCPASREEALGKAVRFLRLAATNGNPDARRRLGDAFWYAPPQKNNGKIKKISATRSVR